MSIPSLGSAPESIPGKSGTGTEFLLLAGNEREDHNTRTKGKLSLSRSFPKHGLIDVL